MCVGGDQADRVMDMLYVMLGCMCFHCSSAVSVSQPTLYRVHVCLRLDKKKNLFCFQTALADQLRCHLPRFTDEYCLSVSLSLSVSL
jgi:hypothetical protein